MLKTLGLALGALVVSTAVWAETPPLEPTVGYEGDAVINDVKGGRSMTMKINGEGNLYRSEMNPQPGMTVYSVINFDTGKIISWMKGGPMAQMGNYYMEMDGKKNKGPMGNWADAKDKVTFTKKGTSTVAGADCTLWHGQPKDGSQGGTVCVTDEGLRLSMTPDGETKPVFEVTRFTTGDQDDALFGPPAGFQPFPYQLPGGAGGAMGPGGMPPGMMGPQ